MNTKPYHAISKIYDTWQESYGTQFSLLMIPYVHQSLKKHNLQVYSMIDLACGTGIFAIEMSKRGIRTYGVDISRGMLDEAKKNKKKYKRRLPLSFSCQDMRNFRLPVKVDLITCFYDSLNVMLTEADLLKVFRSVSRHLKSNGLFVFDMNIRNCFEKLWSSHWVTHHKDFTVISENSFDDRESLGRADVVVFLREGRVYKKYKEMVQERCYRDKDVIDTLKRSRLKVLEKREFNPLGIPSLGNIKSFWVCRRA